MWARRGLTVVCPWPGLATRVSPLWGAARWASCQTWGPRPCLRGGSNTYCRAYFKLLLVSECRFRSRQAHGGRPEVPGSRRADAQVLMRQGTGDSCPTWAWQASRRPRAGARAHAPGLGVAIVAPARGPSSPRGVLDVCDQVRSVCQRIPPQPVSPTSAT